MEIRIIFYGFGILFCIFLFTWLIRRRELKVSHNNFNLGKIIKKSFKIFGIVLLIAIPVFFIFGLPKVTKYLKEEKIRKADEKLPSDVRALKYELQNKYRVVLVLSPYETFPKIHIPPGQRIEWNGSKGITVHLDNGFKYIIGSKESENIKVPSTSYIWFSNYTDAPKVIGYSLLK